MIESVLPVFVGGLLALAGAFIGPHFARRHDRWRAKREDEQLLRNKAVELFGELERIRLSSRAATASSVGRIHDKQVELEPVPEFGQVRALAAVYFPEVLPVLRACEADQKAINNQFYTDIKKVAAKAATGAEVEEVSRVLAGRAMSAHGVKLDLLIKDVDAILSNVVPKLK